MDAVRLGQQVASALDTAHKRKLTHRDVKPLNIIVNVESAEAMVLDFGTPCGQRAGGATT